MAFTGRSLTTIRDAYLAELAYQYELAGSSILTVPASPAWMQGGSLALLLMAQEREAEVLQDQILPDKATTPFLDRHGNVDGVPRLAASPSTILVAITGTPGASAASAGRAMSDSNGTRYNVVSTVIPSSGALDGSGDGSVEVQCTLSGVIGNIGVGTTMTWVTAPVGFNPTGTSAGVSVVGEDAELNPSYASRIIAARQNRPASANRADWRGWVEAVAGVDAAFVYERVYVNAGIPYTGTLGAVSVVALGPAPTTATNTRILSGTELAHIADYIEGTRDTAGALVPTAAQVQLRPVTIAPTSYAILAATDNPVGVAISVTAPGSNAFPFLAPVGDYKVVAFPAPTASAFTIAPAPIAVPASQQVAPGDTVAVYCPTERGLYFLTTVQTVNVATGAVTVSPALPAAPTVGDLFLPATPLWAQVRTAVFSVIDALGPGDTDVAPAVPPAASRWPSPETAERGTLYRSQLEAATLSVRGVANAVVTLPVADVASAPLTLHSLDALRLNP